MRLSSLRRLSSSRLPAERPRPRSRATAAGSGVGGGFGVILLVAGVIGGCPGSGGKAPPLDRAVFPTGLAIDATGDRLIAVSSDFDLAFEAGAVLVADLDRIRDRLTGADVVVEDPWVSGVFVPPFGDRPVLDTSGTQVLVTTRGGNLLHGLTLDGTDVRCGDGVGCDEAPYALQLGGNDPFDILLVGETVGDDGAVRDVRALVTHLSSPDAEFVHLDPRRSDAGRLRVEATTLRFGDDVFGVRSATFAPATAQARARVFALVERRAAGTLIGSDLAVAALPEVDQGASADVARVDVTGITGALTGRDLLVVADPDRGPDARALVMTLRAPDAVARFAIDDATQTIRLTALRDTCKEPTGLASVDVDVDGDPATPATSRLLLTCQGSEAIQALDPRTLEITDAVRFFGRSPYDVVVDATHQLAFVSFFLDNSIGVLSLVDEGVVRLTPVGRLGAALPPPEDGRE
jgi:hypothetical protein